MKHEERWKRWEINGEERKGEKEGVEGLVFMRPGV